MVTRTRIAIAGSLALASGVLAIAPACGSGFLDGLSGGQRDAGVIDTGAPDTGVDARACTLHRVPDPPPPETETAAKITVTMAIDALRIDSASSLVGIIPPTVGVDLDNACTCPEEESCVPPPDAGIKKCVGDGGADNALGAMFGTLGALQPEAFGPDFATKAIRRGSYGALMVIADWNGEPNDAKVLVSFFLSQGAAEAVDGGLKDGGIRMDGTDVWTIDPSSVAGGDAKLGVDCDTDRTNCLPTYFTQSGYVVDNTVVARVNVPFALSASTGRIAIEMNDVTVMAKIEKVGDLYRGKGEFVGRWPVLKVLRTLGEVPINGKPLCDDVFYIGVAKSNVCPGADIASEATSDHKGAQCDAVSTSLRFEGGSAKLGRVYRPSLPEPACQSFTPSCD